MEPEKMPWLPMAQPTPANMGVGPSNNSAVRARHWRAACVAVCHLRRQLGGWHAHKGCNAAWRYNSAGGPRHPLRVPQRAVLTRPLTGGLIYNTYTDCTQPFATATALTVIQWTQLYNTFQHSGGILCTLWHAQQLYNQRSLLGLLHRYREISACSFTQHAQARAGCAACETRGAFQGTLYTCSWMHSFVRCFSCLFIPHALASVNGWAVHQKAATASRGTAYASATPLGVAGTGGCLRPCEAAVPVKVHSA